MLTSMDKMLWNQIKNIDIDLDQVTDPNVRAQIFLLLKALDMLTEEVQQLKEENQSLKDEINRLKGEKGRPKFSGKKGKKGTGESSKHSSENERNRNGADNEGGKGKDKKKSKGRGKKNVVVHETKICELDQSALPKDVVFKGYETVVIRDIVLQPLNTAYRRQVFYSASENKRYIAPLPNGHNGEFGPYLKALVIACHYDYQMTEPSIHRLLSDAGVEISLSSLSRILTGSGGQSEHVDRLHQEKEDIVNAGRQSTTYQQIDDTSARVGGNTYYTQVLCNPFYTAYYTCPNKNRLTVLKVLSGGELRYSVSHEVYILLTRIIPKKHLDKINQFFSSYRARCIEEINQKDFDVLVNELFPDPNKHHKARTTLLEKCAVAAYQNREDAIEILVADDAGQYKFITRYQSLCWVHDGRHYKKDLKPVRHVQREKLERFLRLYWAFFHCLLAFKETPSQYSTERISRLFDLLFSLETGYDALDHQIAKTKEKKESLLLVLQCPDLPLHNNESELGARRQARYRDISFQTRTQESTRVKDSIMTVVQTAKKHGVSVLKYLISLISLDGEGPPLSEFINRCSEPAPCIPN